MRPVDSICVIVPTPLFIGSRTVEIDGATVSKTFIQVEGLVTTELSNAEHFAENISGWDRSY